MSRRKFRISKTTEVDVDVEVYVTNADIIEAIKEDHEFDEILEDLGFIRMEDIGLEEGTILETMKLELIKALMKNATLDQLEQFSKTL